MGDPVYALKGAAASARTTVTELPTPAMLSIRADAALWPIIAEITGLAVPETRQLTAKAEARLVWMSPDELLLIRPRQDFGTHMKALSQALEGHYHLVADVSDMRALFAITGAAPRETLAKLVPADLHPDSFARGEVRRTRLAQVPCAFWFEEDGARLVCFRSVAQYAFDVLVQAAADTAPVGVFPD